MLAPIQDYVSQESAWSSNSSTYQRKYLATSTSKVFAESICKSIYLSTDFRSRKGSVEALNFLINYTIDYLVNYIIITKKANYYWG